MKTPKILYIDLNDGSYVVKERPELKEYLGGTGIATELFLENVNLDKDPLDPTQPIIFVAGYLTPYFPVATKSVAVFYSPLTYSFGESHAGGRLALALKLSGLDGIVIKGKNPYPCYISINDFNVKINNAHPLWGLKATDSATHIRDKEGKAGLRSILRIGPAGENCTAFSMVIVDTYRHFGRLGLGALMGSKNIKAIIITGSGREIDRDINFEEYKTFYEEVHKKVISGSMRKYHEFGTALNIMPLNELKALPTRNLKENSFEKAEDISGEAFAEHVLTRKFACAGCPLGCIHIATRRERFAQEEEWERNDVSYDYELIYALGSLLGIGSRLGILKMIESTEELGLDAIYTGVFLAWTTEALEKGIISLNDLNLESLNFGDVEAYIKVLKGLIYSEKSFYKIARKGLVELTKIYGGSDYALLMNKNAMAGYHTGYANLIGQGLVGIRNAHTDNGGYAIDQENNDLKPEETVDMLLEEEIYRSFFNCTGICLFARKIYDTASIKKASSLIGYEIEEVDIKKLGEKIYLKKLKFKMKTGFDIDKFNFPERYFQTPAMNKYLSKEWVEKAKKAYKKRVELLFKEHFLL
jgi:aldehyde:ferredoxin oxidoreductase